jgi:hypothetical protein
VCASITLLQIAASVGGGPILIRIQIKLYAIPQDGLDRRYTMIPKICARRVGDVYRELRELRSPMTPSLLKETYTIEELKYKYLIGSYIY